MAESKATAPDFAISLTVDMTQAVELRNRLKEVADPAPSFNDMVVKAAAAALTEHPRVNGAYRDGKFELYDNVNIGVAVAAQGRACRPDGLQRRPEVARPDLEGCSRGHREGARQDGHAARTLGRTFTVSNSACSESSSSRRSSIRRKPRSSPWASSKRPAVDEGGRIVAQDQMTLSLVCDHRILYGADGAQFLARVKELLERPPSLAL